MEHLSPKAGDGPQDITATFVGQLAKSRAGDCSAADRLVRFRGDNVDAFRRWLGTIFTNKLPFMLRRLRRGMRRQTRPPTDSDGEFLVAGAGESTLAKLQCQEETVQLSAAMEELEDLDRRLVVSHYLGNLSFQVLAPRFSMTEEALGLRAHLAIAKLERAKRLLAALHRKHMPPHYRKVLCAVRLRSWPVERIANEFGLSESAVRGLLQCAEAWLETPGQIP